MPICNSLALFFNCLTSRLLGERPLTSGGIAGMVIVLIGIAICVDSTQSK